MAAAAFEGTLFSAASSLFVQTTLPSEKLATPLLKTGTALLRV